MSHPTTSPIPRLSSGWDGLQDPHDVGPGGGFDGYDDEGDAPATAATGTTAASGARFSPVRRAQVLAGALVAVAVTLQRPAAEFAYDAGQYWNGPLAMLEGRGVFEHGFLALRGVATAFMYLPAAAAFKLSGDSGAALAVLVENAVLIALAGVLLLPRLVAIWRPVTPLTIWVSGALSALVLAGFAPFPLGDLWGAVLLLTAVAALRRRGRLPLLLSGVAAGLAFNIRPAVLFAVIGLGVVVLVGRRLSGLWYLAGAGLALLPQVALNRVHGIPPWPWPEATSSLTQLQAGYAAYVVRYDTVMEGPPDYPRLFFCSPSMARALGGNPPRSPVELAGAFLHHFPLALLFCAQKISAALHWTLSTPYYVTNPGVNGLFAIVVTAVTVAGAAALLHRSVRHGIRELSVAHVGVVVVWLGSVLALVTSATESRFALPLVLVGIAGVASALADGVRLPRGGAGRLWLAGSLVTVVAVFGLGAWGLQHPLSGDGAMADCATS